MKTETTQADVRLPFHSWLRNQQQWMIDVAQDDDVYKAMKLSYEANSELARNAPPNPPAAKDQP